MDKALKDIQYMTCKASNKAMQMYYMWEHEKMDYKNKHGEYPDEKKLFGKTYRNVIESEIKTIMNTVNTANVAQTNAFVMKKWNTDKSDILNFRKSVASYKLDMPIYLKNSNYKILQGTNGYEIECAMFNRSQHLKHLIFMIDKLDGNKKSILNKLINGIYKQGSMQIIKNKKNKWCLLISFGFEADKKGLDINRTVGVDLGITNALTMQVWDNKFQEWERLSWAKCVVDGGELVHYRQKTVARRIALLKNCKLANVNTGKAGHGKTNRIAPIVHSNDQIANYRDTFNHKYSKFVIDFAIKNDCGIIQMENLKGFTVNTSEKFLENWSYFDLQEKIRYKAEEKGIQVNLINPSFTSQRCSKCGCIEKQNRNCKNNQAKFECVVCGNQENADINAAKNISLPNIEQIIKEKLKT